MLSLIHLFTDELPADPVMANIPRQVYNACYSYVQPKGMSDPKMVMYSDDLANDLQLSRDYCMSVDFTDILCGNSIAAGSHPYAMCYGGHQFGNWAGQLGDGRAINLGEVLLPEGGHQNLQLKGAGPTPYSRTADGFAVLRSSVREFLCSEAMYHLGVPTTRALSLALTGEEVLRDVMYDGNPAYEKGAVVCRVAPSFVRFGNFEIFASRQDHETLRKLTDFVISHYFPHLIKDPDKYLRLFNEVADSTCTMIVHWQRVGFVHGVMNTDNMSILGQTIDYGPYGWMDNYDPDWTPNTTDLPGKRYRFGNQPVIAQWNLLKLANALFPLINNEEGLKNIIHNFRNSYTEKYLAMMKQKLGLFENNNDQALIYDLEKMLSSQGLDMTIFFRQLAEINSMINIADALNAIKSAFYNENGSDEALNETVGWLKKYILRIKAETINQEERVSRMNQVNPKYVLRNYMAQMVIDKTDQNDYTLLYELYEMLKNPYKDQPEYERWYAKRPDWAKEKVGCSMLSCSS